MSRRLWKTCFALIFGVLMTGALVAQEVEPEAESDQETEAQQPAAQQPRRGSVMEEVIVTAQKREQALEDVGISVTALSGAQMREFGFKISTDVIAQVPNAQYNNQWGAGGAANVVIRGVGMTDTNNGMEAPVTTYTDDFYLIAPTTVDFLMLDMERTEVLRGPQGTLFGRNSTGGLFHYISAKPTNEFEAKASLSYGEYEQWRAEGVVSGPLGDRVRARVSAMAFQNNEGFQERADADPGVPDGDQRDFWGIRAQLEWDITDNFLARIKYEHSEIDNINPSMEHRSTFRDPETGLEDFLPPDVDWYGTGPGNDMFGFRGDEVPHRSYAALPTFLDSQTDLVQLNLVWDTEAFTLTSITGYFDYQKFQADWQADGGPITGITVLGLGDDTNNTTPYATDYITQEIRLHGSTSSMEWTAGVYYLSQNQGDTDAEFNMYGAQEYVDLGLLDQPYPLAYRWDFDMESEAIALFGQLEFDLSERVGLIVGGRVSDETKQFAQDTQLLDPFFFVGIGWDEFTSLPPFPYQGKFEDTLYTGKLQLDWRPSDNHLLYASISRGQKVGGFNNGSVLFILEEDVPFDSENLTAYEIGWKSTLGGGRTRLNASAFYYDYKDFQTFSFLNLGSITTNNDAKMAGGEIELTSMPVGNLELSLGASFLDTTVYDVSNGVIVRDYEMANAPPFTLNGLIRYTWDIGSNALSAQVDFVTMDESWTLTVNHPVTLVPSSTNANARIGFGPQNRSWEISLWVRNFTNEDAFLWGFPAADFIGSSLHFRTPPRQIGATLDFNF